MQRLLRVFGLTVAMFLILLAQAEAGHYTGFGTCYLDCYYGAEEYEWTTFDECCQPWSSLYCSNGSGPVRRVAWWSYLGGPTSCP
jgi:hypothetical protein